MTGNLEIIIGFVQIQVALPFMVITTILDLVGTKQAIPMELTMVGIAMVTITLVTIIQAIILIQGQVEHATEKEFIEGAIKRLN